MAALIILSALSSVDASWESGRFGRLVNHSKRRPNCEVRVSSLLFHQHCSSLKHNYAVLPKVEMVKDEPHLILVAAEDIGVGVEITYNYGIK